MKPPVDYSKLDHPDILTVLFHPRRSPYPQPVPPAIDHDIEVDQGVRIGLRFYPAASDEAPNIIFFHGNGEIAADYDVVGPGYNRRGVSLLVADYRGYGRSSGVPTATAIMRDTHVVFESARQWLKANGRTGPVVVMGRSLGSACALEAAAQAQEKIAGLILESAFAITLPLLKRLGADVQALGLTEADGFKNLEKIALITKPTLIIHARHDEIIPVVSAELLQVHCAARSKEFHVIPAAGHNNILACAGELYFELIQRFTDRLQGKFDKRFFRKKTRQRRCKASRRDS